MPAPTRDHDKAFSYRVRLLLSVVGAQVLLLALVHWWPDLALNNNDKRIFDTRGQDLIAFEEIQPTQQSQKPPPPPPPLIPLIPEEDVIFEEEIEITDQPLVLEEYGEDIMQQDAQSTAGAGRSATAAEIGPKPLRFVEPEYTRAARRRKIAAEVTVEVLVDEKGLVREAKIVERYLVEGPEDAKRSVNELNYGLEESALAAAQRWMFQPARQNGKPVQSYTTITFSFGG